MKTTKNITPFYFQLLLQLHKAVANNPKGCFFTSPGTPKFFKHQQSTNTQLKGSTTSWLFSVSGHISLFTLESPATGREPGRLTSSTFLKLCPHP